tara:strand:- start:290 stop:586 length:297 start_codon:yes stop_codon:yes gene_type:complete
MKKGAMALSTTALVTLILGIVTLALLIGFVRGNFSKSASQFEEQSAPAPLLSPPLNDPLIVSKEVVIAESGSTFRIDVGARNPTNADWPQAYPVISCS